MPGADYWCSSFRGLSGLAGGCSPACRGALPFEPAAWGAVPSGLWEPAGRLARWGLPCPLLPAPGDGGPCPGLPGVRPAWCFGARVDRSPPPCIKRRTASANWRSGMARSCSILSADSSPCSLMCLMARARARRPSSLGRSCSGSSATSIQSPAEWRPYSRITLRRRSNCSGLRSLAQVGGGAPDPLSECPMRCRAAWNSSGGSCRIRCQVSRSRPWPPGKRGSR